MTKHVQTIHQFKRSFSTLENVYDVDYFGGAMEFRLNQLPNYAEFTALYNAYKIYFVKVQFIFDRNSVESVPSGTQFIPNMVSCLDNNDGNALAAHADFQQYNTYRIRRMDRPIKILLKPKPATAVYYTGATPRYAVDTSDQWIDISGVTVPFYGIKYGYLGGSGGGIGTYILGRCMITATVYYKMRDPR